MSFWPHDPLWVGNQSQLGTPTHLLPNTSGARSHLVQKAPTGEPIEQAYERQQLSVQIADLRARIELLEAARDTPIWVWAARWAKLRAWLLQRWKAVRRG